MGHTTLPQMVLELKEELACLRAASHEANLATERSQEAEQALKAMKTSSAATEKELLELRAMQREMGRLQVEVEVLQVSNGRQAAVEQGLQQELTRLRTNVSTAETKATETEQRATASVKEVQDLRLASEAMRVELEAMKKELAARDKELRSQANLAFAEKGRRARGRSGRQGKAKNSPRSPRK